MELFVYLFIFPRAFLVASSASALANAIPLAWDDGEDSHNTHTVIVTAIVIESDILYTSRSAFGWPTNTPNLLQSTESVEASRTHFPFPQSTSVYERPVETSIDWSYPPMRTQSAFVTTPSTIRHSTTRIPSNGPNSTNDTDLAKEPMEVRGSPILAKTLFSSFVILTAIMFGLLVRREWLFATGRRRVVAEPPIPWMH